MFRSPIRDLPPERVAAAIASSASWTEAIDSLGLRRSGNVYAMLKRLSAERCLDIQHMAIGGGRTISANRKASIPLDSVMVAGSSYARGSLKRRLLASGALQNACAVCGGGAHWNGLPLVLHLDHVNGVADDHRIENLRLLCPNCHSQTATYSGKNKKVVNGALRVCMDCAAPRSKRSVRCRKCAACHRHSLKSAGV